MENRTYSKEENKNKWNADNNFNKWFEWVLVTLINYRMKCMHILSMNLSLSIWIPPFDLILQPSLDLRRTLLKKDESKKLINTPTTANEKEKEQNIVITNYTLISVFLVTLINDLIRVRERFLWPRANSFEKRKKK